MTYTYDDVVSKIAERPCDDAAMSARARREVGMPLAGSSGYQPGGPPRYEQRTGPGRGLWVHRIPASVKKAPLPKRVAFGGWLDLAAGLYGQGSRMQTPLSRLSAPFHHVRLSRYDFPRPDPLGWSFQAVPFDSR